MLTKMGASQSYTANATDGTPPPSYKDATNTIIDLPLPTVESVGRMKRVPCSTSPVLMRQKGRKHPPILPKSCKVGAIAMGMDGHMYRNAGSRWVMIKGEVETAAKKMVGPKGCPTGKVKNPATGRCVMPKSKSLKAASPRRAKKASPKSPKACPPGKVRNQQTKRCRKVATPKRKSVPKKSPKKSPPKTPKRAQRNQTLKFVISSYTDNAAGMLNDIKREMPGVARGMEGIGYDKFVSANFRLVQPRNGGQKFVTVNMKVTGLDNERVAATADNLVRDLNDATENNYNLRYVRD